MSSPSLRKCYEVRNALGSRVTLSKGQGEATVEGQLKRVMTWPFVAVMVTLPATWSGGWQKGFGSTELAVNIGGIFQNFRMFAWGLRRSVIFGVLKLGRATAVADQAPISLVAPGSLRCQLLLVGAGAASAVMQGDVTFVDQDSLELQLQGVDRRQHFSLGTPFHGVLLQVGQDAVASDPTLDLKLCEIAMSRTPGASANDATGILTMRFSFGDRSPDTGHRLLRS